MKSVGINVIVAAGGLACFVFLAPHVLAAGLAAPAGQETTPPTDVGTLLGPLTAAAVSIERVVEMIWNWIESAAPQAVAALGMGRGWAQYAHDEVLRWEGRLSHLSGQARDLNNQPGGPDADPAKSSALARDIDMAQQKLLDAQQQIQTGIKSQRYVSIKQSGSVVLSLGMGLVTSATTGLDLFKLLNLSQTAGTFGIILTGLIIGAGSGPVHSLIGLLQQARDVTDQAANLFASRSKQNATQALANIATANAAAAGAEIVPVAPVTPDAGGAVRGLEAVPPPPPAEVAPPVPVVTPEQLRTIERLARR